MPTLAEQLQEDLIADALAAPAAVRTKNEWREPVTWTFTGYVARIRLIECPRCHAWEWVSLGVFAEECGKDSKTGRVRSRKLTQAVQWPLNTKGQKMELMKEVGQICWRCLSTDFGFDNMNEPSDVPTAVSGEGFTVPGRKTALGFTRRAEDEKG